MKKFLLAAAAAFMLALPSQAQVKFGLRGGLNINNFSMSSDCFKSKNTTGFYVGPTVLISLPIIDIDASVVYDQRTFDAEGQATVTEEDGSTYTEYTTMEGLKKKNIDIQANIRKGFGLGSAASVFIFAGPQFGFNVGSKKEVENWTWKSSDFSINLGVGAVILNHLEAKVNYNIACGKSADASLSSTLNGVKENLTPKANAWQIGLAYYF